VAAAAGGDLRLGIGAAFAAAAAVALLALALTGRLPAGTTSSPSPPAAGQVPATTPDLPADGGILGSLSAVSPLGFSR
jgi:hypothetical protein